MHLSDDELIRYVAHSRDARLERHVTGCPACAAEVRRLRSALGALVFDTIAQMDERSSCLDDAAIALLAEGRAPESTRGEQLLHLSTCGSCRSAVSAVAGGLKSERLSREIRRLERRSARAWLSYATPLGAAAALLLLLRSPGAEDPSAHRGATTLDAPVAIAPSGPTTTARVLRWHAVRGADRYRVTVFDADGAVLFETLLADTVAALPPGVIVADGRPYYWIIAARMDFDRWESSDLAEFSVPSTAR